MDRITDYLKSTGSYARMKELRAAGFQTLHLAEREIFSLSTLVLPSFPLRWPNQFI
ncbi:MAG: hypothetical protein Q7U02_00120 [Desulfosalsimonadaceae bacterium]|nr:hypothetical protein [Desulfosalsimonadaceae bacterium]